MSEVSVRPAPRAYDAAKGARAAQLGRISLIIFAVVFVCNLAVTITRIGVITSGGAGDLRHTSPHFGDAGWLGLYAALRMLSLLVTVLVVVAFIMRLVWARRLAANGAALGLPARRTPGWAVGSWFIPIANLVIPFQCIEDAGPPEVRSTVRRWWLLNVIGVLFIFAGTIGRNLSSAEGPLLTQSALAAIGELVMIAQVFVGIPMVRDLEVAHTRLAA